MRILGLAAALVLGLFVGSVATTLHQGIVEVLGLRMPLGIVIAFFVLIALLTGLRLVGRNRGLALAGALGALLPVFVFTLPGAGGAVIIPANTLGFVWIIGSFAIATIALAWPTVKRSRGATARGL